MSHVIMPVAGAALPPDVVRFCTERELLPTLEQALRLAESSFHPVLSLSAELEVDPETGEEGVVVLAGVSMPVDEVLRRKADYTRRWVESVPSEARHSIRLVFHVA